MKAKLKTKWGIYKEIDIDYKAMYVIVNEFDDSVQTIDHYLFDIPEDNITFAFSGVEIDGDKIVFIYKECGEGSNSKLPFDEEEIL